MFKRLIFVKRRSDLTHQEFRDYYENVHVPLVSSMRTIQPLVYRRNYVTPSDPNADALMAGRGSPAGADYDCITEVVFRTREDAAPPPADVIERLRRDEANFMAPDGLAIQVVEVYEEF